MFTIFCCGSIAGPLVCTGTNGPGVGRQIVLLAGDEEYRSEESMPMLARVLAYRHGFRCTVLFSINPAAGTIDPLSTTNLPGLETLDSADLCIMALRFRELPDEQMRHFVAYVNAGKPIIAFRTSTHAFAYNSRKESPYAKYDWRSKQWEGGFGRQVLGETWVSHHGDHGKQSTRGIWPEVVSERGKKLLRGVNDVWGPTDVYTVRELPSGSDVVLYGQVLRGMRPEDPPVSGPKNNPMMPIVWYRGYRGEQGKTSRILTTTMGAAVDLENEGLRRLLVNSAYNLLDLEVPAKADVRYVGEYKPSYFGFGKFKQGLRPEDLR